MTMASPAQRPVQMPQQPMQQQAPQQVVQQSPVPSAPPPVDVRYDDPYTATMLKEPSPRPAAAEPPRKEPPRKEAKRSGGLVPIVGALVGGLVLGLGVGAGAYFGGLVPARGTAAAPASTAPASVAPKQVEVTVDKFPAQFLGMTRDDLDGSANAAAARTSAEALSKSMEASYGGPGIQMSYGSGKGPIALVWVQNGFLPAPVATVDYQIVRSQQMTSWIEIPGTPTTQCRLANYPAVKVASAGEIEAAKQSVFNGKGDGYIVCVRHDEKRNVSVQVGVQKWGTTDTRAQIAVKTAAALDEAWAALTK